MTVELVFGAKALAAINALAYVYVACIATAAFRKSCDNVVELMNEVMQ